MLMITAAQTASIWNVGIKTAAAQNMVAIGFIEKQLGKTITWLDWFIAGAPYSVLMSIALYFIMTRMMKPEVQEMAGGRAAIRKAARRARADEAGEKKLLVLVLALLGFWSTEGVLHRFDTTSTTVAAIALMFLPGIGMMDWKEAQKGSRGARWCCSASASASARRCCRPRGRRGWPTWSSRSWGCKQATALFILGVLSLFLIVIHLGFASATALASAMIPIVIACCKAWQTPGINVVGMTMLLQFVVSFGFILVVNAPQNMVAYGTETFDARDFVRTGLVLTLAAMVLLVVFALTYWPWMGYMTTAR